MANRRLAHLNALRALEAVARHRSFLRASRELSVTAGAISQQIRLLEDYYGVQLFRRHARSITLTDECAAVLPDLSAGFDSLSRAIARLQSETAGGQVSVSAPPTFAVRWLAHRLGAFSMACPDVRIALDSSDRLVDLRREDVDLAIRYGKGSWPGLRAERLIREWIMPVCAPAYLERAALRTPEEARSAQLIHDRTMLSADPAFPTWDSWFAAMGVAGSGGEGALHFSSSLAAIQAAIDGHGLILGRSAVIDDELRAGRLVCPFAGTISSGNAYYLVQPEGAVMTAGMRAFADWLTAEAASFERATEGLWSDAAVRTGQARS
jgi:LysR family glycine cleavage system transcriptional activator